PAVVSTAPPKSGVKQGSTCKQASAVPVENSTQASPNPALGGPFVRTDISPEDLLKALGRLRREAAAEIERLIDLLDEIDPDPDLEPAGDELEPSLGAIEAHPAGDSWRTRRGVVRDEVGAQLGWADARAGDDREISEDVQEGEDGEDCEPNVDDELSGDEHEPALGAFDRLFNQDHGWRQTLGVKGRWPAHANNDFELEHDGREPGVGASRAGRAR
ncbi:MAG: hypothetical protein JWR73_2738, partial [Tardiphaga sp.]|nr:hypothetical protein [Tardiphaga sp.]